MFYGREISTMMPCQSVFGGKLHIIRPLAGLEEGLIKKYSRERGLPTFKNACSSSESSRRNYVKKLLDSLEIDNPAIRHNIYTALGHVKPDYLPSKKK
jgi:tRNA 2-thiocytidine biosynthesis protein TtcA